MNIQKLFKDIEYKKLMIEYHDFMSYILQDINRYTIHSSSVRFTKCSVIYKYKDEFINMLRDVFPEFVITFETNIDEHDLAENEMSITIDWKAYKASIMPSK
jgi:hypothetical protein